MSSILISGMEMPTEEEISKCIIIRHDGEVWIGEFDNLVDGGFVACYSTNPMRAVPVPPHGDLIDRAVLIDSFEPSDFWNSSAEDNCFAAIHVTNSMPTIIPAEPAEEALRCDPCKPTQPECGTCEWAEEGKK